MNKLLIILIFLGLILSACEFKIARKFEKYPELNNSVKQTKQIGLVTSERLVEEEIDVLEFNRSGQTWGRTCKRDSILMIYPNDPNFEVTCLPEYGDEKSLLKSICRITDWKNDYEKYECEGIKREKKASWISLCKVIDNLEDSFQRLICKIYTGVRK